MGLPSSFLFQGPKAIPGVFASMRGISLALWIGFDSGCLSAWGIFLSIVKKTALIIAGSLLLFFLLASLDDFSNVQNTVKYFLKRGFEKGPIVRKGEPERLIGRINSELARVYRSGDPSRLKELTLSDGLRKYLAADLIHLNARNRVVDMNSENIRIKRTFPVSQDTILITTVERISTTERDLSSGRIAAVYPPADYEMCYTVKKLGTEWQLQAMDIIKVSTIEKRKSAN